ncbi:MAG: ATP-binding cassette domain-containing protein, partial [bacterium]
MTAIIETVDLVKKYRVGSEIITALNGVNLTVAKGEFICILGTSGSGKTTLLNLASGLERPTSGKIFLGGIPLH